MEGVTRIEVARAPDAADLQRFLARMGMTTTREGTAVDVDSGPAAVTEAVDAWLAESHAPLVPIVRGRALVLRPPSD